MLSDFNFYNKKYSKAKKYYEMLQNNSDGKVFFNLGYCYYFVDRNYSKAIKLFVKSLKRGYLSANVYIGMFYIYGIFVEHSNWLGSYFLESYNYAIYNKKRELPLNNNLIQVILYFELSEISKNSNILLHTGNLYFFGINREKSYSHAKKFYELSSLLKNSDASINLGILYMIGYSVSQDFEKAKAYFEPLANENNSLAITSLGNLYVISNKDYYKAKEYYEKAAKLNNSDALYNLGYLYYVGLDVVKDLTRSKYYFKKIVRIR